jgi:hypothetical protein
VHFPTDPNLRRDAVRKRVDWTVKFHDQFGYALSGWRKAKDWRQQPRAVENNFIGEISA